MGGTESKTKRTVDLGKLDKKKLADAIEDFVASNSTTFGLLRRLQRIDRVVSVEDTDFEFSNLTGNEGTVRNAVLRVSVWLDDTETDGTSGGLTTNEDPPEDGEEGYFVFTVRVLQDEYTCCAAKRA